jgi:hypothetical protein
MLAIEVHDLAQNWRELSHKLARACLGAVFVAVAVISIEYDETIAPTLTRLAETFSIGAGDLAA